MSLRFTGLEIAKKLAVLAIAGGFLQLASPTDAMAAASSSSNTRDQAASSDTHSASGPSFSAWLGAMGGGTMDGGVGLRAGYTLDRRLTLSLGGEFASIPPYGTESECYYGYDHYKCEHSRVSAFAGVGYVFEPQGFSPWLQADAGVAWLTGGSSWVPDETIARFQATLGAGVRYGFERAGLGLQGTAGALGDVAVFGARLAVDVRF